jgi:RNA polymerase sigma factor (sigma-70 family)
VKFVTYADWWIRKSMLSAIQEQADPVRIPGYRSEKAARIREARKKLRSARTGEPGIDEVAEASGVPAREVHRILAMSRTALSLHQPAKPDGSLLLEEVLENRAQSETTERWIREQFTAWVLNRLSDLDPRERRILILRYGLPGRPALTLRKIGERVCLSRERVRQIEFSALARLREMI